MGRKGRRGDERGGGGPDEVHALPSVEGVEVVVGGHGDGEAHRVGHVRAPATVEVLLQHLQEEGGEEEEEKDDDDEEEEEEDLVYLGGEGDIVVGELAPGYQQHRDGVVVEPLVPGEG